MLKKITILIIMILPVALFSQPTAQFSIDNSNGQYCLGDTVKILNTSSNYVISHWTFGDGTDTWAENPNHVYQSSGTFSINLAVTDNSGISATTSMQVTINPKPSVDIINNTSMMSLTANVTGTNSPTFVWLFGTDTTAETDAVIYYLESGIYSVIASNEFGCSDFKSIEIDLSSGGPDGTTDTLKIVVLNNILTPGLQDGANDVLFIQELSNYDFPCTVTVYNKWGQLVYLNTSYTNLGGFEGRDNSGKELDPGTYYYVIKSQERKTATGYIDLIR